MLEPGDDPDAADAQALSAYLQGDLTALDALVQRHRTALFGYALALCGNRSEADDVFQETWLRVIRYAARFKQGHFKGWLMRIAHNVAIDRLRRRKPNVSLDRESASGGSLGQVLPDEAPTPAARYETLDRHREALCAVATLPVAQREVFLLRTQSDLSFQEIAKLQKVPLNTALGRMHYAVNRLRHLLGDNP